MRMIFIHGIAQEGKSSEIIHAEWRRILHKVYAKHGPDPLGRLSRIDAAFYGDALAAFVEAPPGAESIAQGVEAASDGFDEFARHMLADIGIKLGATAEMYAEELGGTHVAQGAGPHKKWVKAVARVIERVAPKLAKHALSFVDQAYAYIDNPYAAREIDKLVRPLFEDDEPAIVVAHSLGTIIAYKLLREFSEKGRSRNSPLFLTLGSPLGIDLVRMSFEEPRKRPANVARWLNGADPEDFVALRSALTADNFGPDIENISDIENGPKNPHGIEGYLADKRVAAAIRDAIG